MVQILGSRIKSAGKIVNSGGGACAYGQYKGERCFDPGDADKKIAGRYPYTSNGGKLDVGRLRNAPARAAQNNDIATIKKGGFCNVAKRAGLKSNICNDGDR